MDDTQTSLRIVEVQEKDLALWDAFIKSSPQGTFFHTTTWTELIAATFGRRLNRCFCLRNDQPVGGFTYLDQKKLFWNLVTPTPLFPFNAPVFYQPQDEKYQKTISRYLEISIEFDRFLRKRYDYWVLDTPAMDTDLRAHIWQGAAVEPRYTYLVPLDEKGDRTENYNQTIRKKLRQADQNKVVVEETADISIIANLYQKSYLRHGLHPLLSKEMLTRFLHGANDLPQVKIYTARANGNINAFRVVLADMDTVYDLLAGSDDDSGISSAYLVHHILGQFEQTHRKFDFMGADHPWIEQFKRGFGGRLVQGFRITGHVKFPLSLIVKMQKFRQQRQRKT